jgi:tyrosyl-tRNA synthetase
MFKTYDEFEKDYINGQIYPKDLKESVAYHINLLLEPVREHFEKDPYAKKILELIRVFTEK